MNGTKAIIRALNVAYEERERRSFLRLNLVAFLFTLGGILEVVLALTVIVVVPAALSFSWLGPLASIAVRVCSFGLLLRSVVLGVALLYCFGPSRANAKWRWITPGSLVAAGDLVARIGTAGFSEHRRHQKPTPRRQASVCAP